MEKEADGSILIWIEKDRRGTLWGCDCCELTLSLTEQGCGGCGSGCCCSCCLPLADEDDGDDVDCEGEDRTVPVEADAPCVLC